MRKLQNRRDKAVKRLLELAPNILIGSISEAYRTCGQPKCRCHTVGPKHGPYQTVNYQGDNGRTTGYYVAKSIQKTVAEGLASWKTFQALAKELAHINKEIMQADRIKAQTKTEPK